MNDTERWRMLADHAIINFQPINSEMACKVANALREAATRCVELEALVATWQRRCGETAQNLIEAEDSLKLCRQQSLFLFDAGKKQGQEIMDLKRQLGTSPIGLDVIANKNAIGWGNEPDDGTYVPTVAETFGFEPDDGGSGKL